MTHRNTITDGISSLKSFNDSRSTTIEPTSLAIFVDASSDALTWDVIYSKQIAMYGKEIAMYATNCPFRGPIDPLYYKDRKVEIYTISD